MISIDIRPATSVYGTYRRLSYKAWFAIAEFIDNSTQSYYDHIKVLKEDPNFSKLVINIRYDQNEGILEIVDNAYGMNWEDFQRALILDKPPVNKEGRNEFGMGLKTAACWFGDLWTVETTEYGANKKFSATMDIKKFENEKVTTVEPNIDFVPFETHYTKITIKNLNQNLGSNAISKTKDLLQKIYRNDLRTGEIDIIWNGTHLEYTDIEMLTDELPDGSTKIWKDNVNFEVSDPYGKIYHVKGWIGLQAKGITKQSGFALLRRGRVVIGADNNYYPEEIFHSGQTYEKLYLLGELDLQDFEITQAKDGFQWDNGLEDNFIQELIHILGEKGYFDRIKKLKNKNEAKKVSEITEEQRKEIITSTVLSYQNAFKKNRTFEEINKESNENQKEIQTLLPKDNFDTVSEIYQFSVENYRINVKWDDRSEIGTWLSIANEEKNPDGTYQFDIIINIRHKFFTPYQNQPEFLTLINKMAIALVLSEKKAKSATSNPDQLIEAFEIRTHMNNILNRLATDEEN